MAGFLSRNIIDSFKIQFHENCIELLLDGCNGLCTLTGLSDLTENNITVRLLGLLRKSDKRKNLQISIQREAYIDSLLAMEGESDADTAPRIDLRYGCWEGSTEHEFYVECKNLAETDWKKQTNGAFVKSSYLLNRYIDTGIDNFISGRYPNGCLVGYILQGTIAGVVDKLNMTLVKRKRASEQLRHGVDSHYQSSHLATHLSELDHFFFKLS